VELLRLDPATFLGAFWFETSPDKNEFRPSIEKFTRWNVPHVNLEFDHAGRFEELPGDQWLYSAGESKSTYSGIL
jgi:hypothetical protein